MAAMVLAGSGALLRISTISSIVLPCEWNSPIILSCTQTKRNPVISPREEKLVQVIKNMTDGTQTASKTAKNTYHSGIPWHGFEQFIEELRAAEMVDDPVIAVAVDDGLVEVEHHNDVGHGSGNGNAQKCEVRGSIYRKQDMPMECCS